MLESRITVGAVDTFGTAAVWKKLNEHNSMASFARLGSPGEDGIEPTRPESISVKYFPARPNRSPSSASKKGYRVILSKDVTVPSGTGVDIQQTASIELNVRVPDAVDYSDVKSMRDYLLQFILNGTIFHSMVVNGEV